MFVSRTYGSEHFHILSTHAQHLQILRESQHTLGLCVNISLIFLSGSQTLSIRISDSFVRELERRRVPKGTLGKSRGQCAVCVACSHGETNWRIFHLKHDRHFCSIATSDKRHLALTWRQFLSSGYNGNGWPCNVHSPLHNYEVWKYVQKFTEHIAISKVVKFRDEIRIFLIHTSNFILNYYKEREPVQPCRHSDWSGRALSA